MQPTAQQLGRRTNNIVIQLRPLQPRDVKRHNRKENAILFGYLTWNSFNNGFVRGPRYELRKLFH